MTTTPKFPSVKNSFHAELKRRINEYFETTGQSVSGNARLYLKAGILVSVLMALYVHLVFFTPAVPIALVECALLGLSVASIGFNIMHDGAHGSFSEHKWVNKVAAFSLNVLGGSSFMWNIKHNVIHHAYTNVDGVDDDIDIQPWMRMSTTQPRLKMHRYQHLYFWMLYSLLYILWVFVLDYTKYFRKKIGATPLKKMSTRDHITFWSFKLVYLTIFVIVPILALGFTSWLIGFLTMTLLAGFVLSIVFQLAHTVEHTHFPVASVDTGRLEDEWAVHQLKTTANFAPRNRVVSWLVGGLNFQIEHHLFPKISHIHYSKLRLIVKQACHEYGVPYIEYPRMGQAVVSHISFLKHVGRA